MKKKKIQETQNKINKKIEIEEKKEEKDTLL
jgi:hypothetical protein